VEFSEVKSETQSWLLDLPSGASSRVPGWVNEAVRQACERHNFRFMEAEAQYTTVDQQRLLTALESDWKESRGEPYLINQDGSTTPINWARSESDMVRTYAAQLPDEGNAAAPDEGQPRYLYESVDVIDVYPLPDDGSDWDNGLYRVVVPYWKFLATLTQDTDSNAFTTGVPFYCIWKAVSLGFAWNRDEERSQFYEAKAEKLYRSFERKDKLSRLPDRMTLAVRTDVYAGRPRAGNRG